MQIGVALTFWLCDDDHDHDDVDGYDDDGDDYCGDDVDDDNDDLMLITAMMTLVGVALAGWLSFLFPLIPQLLKFSLLSFILKFQKVFNSHPPTAYILSSSFFWYCSKTC